MSVFFNAKLKVDGEEHIKKVLDYLYGLGFKWATNQPPRNLADIGSLYVYETGKIFYNTVQETTWYFDAHENEVLKINFGE